MKLITRLCIIPAMILCFDVTGLATVTDSSSCGFSLRYEVAIRRGPDTVYYHLVNDIGKWWNRDHTYSGNADNLSINPVAQGCFCEKIPPSATIEHMRVLYADPGKVLRMQGGLGPLQSMAVSAVMTFKMVRAGHGTTLVVDYTVGGYYPGGFGKLSLLVDQVLAEQVNRLRGYCEQSH